MARRREAGPAAWYQAREAAICPLCAREIPDGQGEWHHLVPRSKGGKQTQYLHRICHRQIHALFSETALAREYATLEALLAHPAVQRFVAWVKAKPIHFVDRAKRSNQRR